ncbi:hypothetical protein [Neisseria iguanae]|uniref:hypothetical protein n=1 Tax=Neisseria iguanae TaxID=90242 RepID=UPI0011B1D9FF|nr:hypothetical protein [Neisseria iguanae]
MQVKSKERVAKHGEVFTNPREVNAMLDLVQSQIEDMDKTFLEPACGNGNFLAEILRRRMVLLNQKYRNSPFEYEMKTVQAVCSLYGIELLPDNAAECRERLVHTVTDLYLPKHKSVGHFPKIEKVIRHVLQRNIVCGDALNYCDEAGEPIVLTQWQFVANGRGKVKPILFELETAVETTGGGGTQGYLFGDHGEPARIVPHNHELPMTHYLELADEPV